MGIFSKFFRQKIGTETMKTIETIKHWERCHFPCLNDSSRNNRYSIYLTDSREKFTLSDIRIPKPSQPEQKNILGILKDIADFFYKDRLPLFIAEYRENFRREIADFTDNLSKLKHLDKDFRKDPIFGKIDYIFNLKLKVLYNELVFCKFNKLGEPDYFSEVNKKFSGIYEDIQSLNNDFSECMYAMSCLEYADVRYHIESINMHVEMITQTTKEILNN